MTTTMLDQLPLPHCDQSILHSPGTCEYCDMHPYEQALREHWRINFSDTSHPDYAPCPSTYFRSAGLRDRWHGNLATSEPAHDEWLASITQWVGEINEEEARKHAADLEKARAAGLVRTPLRERIARWFR